MSDSPRVSDIPTGSAPPLSATWNHRRPGAPPRQAKHEAPPPPALPGYEDLELIGEGGMGVVYRARDPRLKRAVALKMIRPALFSPQRLAWFQSEAEALARLQHPHIVQVFAREEASGWPVLVLEFVPGGTLEELLRRGPLPAVEAARLVAVLARAVQYAHASGVVHRDLKPANVLLAPPVEGNSGTFRDGFPKISDFGLARLADDGSHDTAGALLGTPAYMAPEQADGVGPVGPPADVWALGVILYRALTGRLPFAAENPLEVLRLVRQADPLPPRQIAPSVPEELQRAFLACLAKDPSTRPTAAGLAHLLEQYCAEPDQATTEFPAEPPRLRRPRRRAAVVFVTALAAMAFLWLLMGAARLLSLKTESPQGTPPAHAAVEERPDRPLRISTFQVVVGAKGLVISRDVRGADPGDRLGVAVELSEPAYAYVIAFGCEGEERLLWPRDAGAAPAKVARLSLPPAGEHGLLIPRDGEGIAAVAVAASRRSLPPFAEWRKQVRGLRWHPMPASWQALEADGERVESLLPGEGAGPPPPGPLMRVIDGVAKTLRYSGGVDAVRLLAFPVGD
jgi:hypothetical protein